MRNLLIAGMILLAPATAWAECAWVLWEEQIVVAPNRVIQGTRWSPMGGYPDIAECMKAVPEGSEEPRADDRPGALVKEYRCFPDTIDPRGR